MIARDDTNNKCRVRIAHAFHPSLKIRVRDAHPTIGTPNAFKPGLSQAWQQFEMRFSNE